ncbi:MAG: purine-nucleoside phosphorylase [Eubacterium sp.]|nr:purine-nucleoside phosphorylase [Eubacterium sp.]
MLSSVFEKVESCYNQIADKVSFKPKVAIVLGSGLGSLAETIEVVDTVNYGDIDGFPVSTVDGHTGRFVFGNINKVPVVIMQGRVHYYEGYDIDDVVLPIRVMKKLGAEILFLTNSAGGVNTMYRPGDFMMIADHIGSFMPSPLRGENNDEWGKRFPSLDNIYDAHLCDCIRNAARACNVPLREGVYVQMKGPMYETAAEVKMCQVLGGDAVGMSTAVEAIAGRHMGMKVCGLSCITNMACGISKTPLNHMEVTEVGEKMSPTFKNIVVKAVEKMAVEETPIASDETDIPLFNFAPVEDVSGAIIDDM